MLRKSVMQTRESVSLEADLWQSKQEYITRKMNTPQLIFFKGPLVRWISSSPKLNQKFSQKTHSHSQSCSTQGSRVFAIFFVLDVPSNSTLWTWWKQSPDSFVTQLWTPVLFLLFFISIRVVWSQCMIGEIASSSRVSGVGLLLLNMTAHGSRCKKVISFTKQIHRGFFPP